MTVRRKTGTPWVLSFHPRGTGMIARVSGRPGGFLVDPDAIRKLGSAFEKAVAPPVTPPKKR